MAMEQHAWNSQLLLHNAGYDSDWDRDPETIARIFSTHAVMLAQYCPCLLWSQI